MRHAADCLDGLGDFLSCAFIMPLIFINFKVYLGYGKSPLFIKGF
jgi:hypothetical protein